MRRVNNWQAVLSAEIQKAQHRPFKWGVHDCSLWTCDVVLALTGTDIGHDFRGKYSTSRTAREVMQEFAGDLEAVSVKRAEEFGMQEVPPTHASRGDVVLVKSGSRKALGIVGSDGMHAYCAGIKGLIRMPRSLWLRSWKV